MSLLLINEFMLVRLKNLLEQVNDETNTNLTNCLFSYFVLNNQNH